MTEFGKTLREAREQKGLTISQIAETTHLLPQIVEDLENEDFHRISAPIYGRGFVKLYCEAVGLEAKPLVDEFMAILNGERAPAIRLKEVELPAEPPAAPEPPPPPPPPVYTQPELGESAAPAVDAVASPRPVDAESLPRSVDAESLPRQDDPPPSPARQYHPDYAQPAYGPTVNFGRLAILAGGAIVIIVLLIWGGRALYRASMGVTDAPAVEAAPAVDAESLPRQTKTTKDKKQETRNTSGDAKQETRNTSGDAKQKTKDTKPNPSAKKPARTPKTVPPLYID